MNKLVAQIKSEKDAWGNVIDRGHKRLRQEHMTLDRLTLTKAIFKPIYPNDWPPKKVVIKGYEFKFSKFGPDRTPHYIKKHQT